MSKCIFCKISQQELPSKKIYEDEFFFAFDDIHPIAPVHFLIIPKEHIESLMHVDQRASQLLGSMLILAKRLAHENGLKGGFKLLINSGKAAGQEVPHLHVHVTGSRE